MRRWLPLLLTFLCWPILLHSYSTSGHGWGVPVIGYYTNYADFSMRITLSEFQAAIDSANSQWNAQAGPSVPTFVRKGSTTISTAQMDYTSTVILRNANPPADCSYCMSETFYWWDNTGKVVDFDQIWYEPNYAYYAGVDLNTMVGCSGNGEYVADVGTHEYGHALGMNHSAVTTATMYPTNNYCDTSWISLDPDDLQGILSLYPRVITTTTVPPTTTTIPPSGPTVPTAPIPSNGQKNRGINQDVAWTGCGGCTYDLTFQGSLLAAGLSSPSSSLPQLQHRSTYTWSVLARRNGQTAQGPTWTFSTR